MILYLHSCYCELFCSIYRGHLMIVDSTSAADTGTMERCVQFISACSFDS